MQQRGKFIQFIFPLRPLLVILIVISIFIPSTFLADDFEHVWSYHQNAPFEYLKLFVFRNPVFVFWHRLLFQLFIQWPLGPILAKFLIWSSLLLSTILILKEIWPEFKEHFPQKKWTQILPFFIAFYPNNYAWNYWPTMMTHIPSLLFVALGLRASCEHKKGLFSKALFYLLASLTFECLAVLCILVESIKLTQNLKEPTFKNLTIKLFKNTIFFFIMLVLFKVICKNLTPIEYTKEWTLKGHLLYQFFALCFLHDYYKIRWATGLIHLSFWALLLIRLKKQNFFKKYYYTILLFIGGCSYYFIIMDYSARRALGGQLYFWGAVEVILLFEFLKKETNPSLKKVLLTLYGLHFFSHSFYIFHQKFHDQKSLEAKIITIQKKMKNLNPSELQNYFDNPRYLNMDFQKDTKTKWNIVNDKQIKGVMSLSQNWDLQ